MRKTDLKAGTIYAHQDSSYGHPWPKLLLDSGMWKWRRAGGGYVQAHQHDRPGRGSWSKNARGYLVLSGDIDVLEATDWKAAMTRFLDSARDMPGAMGKVYHQSETDQDLGLPEGVHLALVTSLAKLKGEYRPVMAEREEAHRKQEELTAERDKRTAALAARATAAAQTFEAAGFTADVIDRYGSYTLTLSLDEAERMAAYLRGPGTTGP